MKPKLTHSETALIQKVSWMQCVLLRKYPWNSTRCFCSLCASPTSILASIAVPSFEQTIMHKLNHPPASQHVLRKKPRQQPACMAISFSCPHNRSISFSFPHNAHLVVRICGFRFYICIQSFSGAVFLAPTNQLMTLYATS